ncbi:MAG: signal peptidase I [Cyanobacteria bacterium P01_A01_bin.17]
MSKKLATGFSLQNGGDIIVFQAPQKALEAAKSDTQDAYLKRIVGMPGEEIAVRDGQVLVDGRVLAEDYVKAPPAYVWGPSVVPEGHYLVLGDNRNSSSDGHVWGFLSEETIIGKAAVRFWPPGRIGGLD